MCRLGLACCCVLVFGLAPCLGAELELSSDLVCARLGHPVICVLSARNRSAGRIHLVRVDIDRDRFSVLRYPESISAGGSAEISLLFKPDRLGELIARAELAFVGDDGLSTRAICTLQGIVNGPEGRAPATHSQLGVLLGLVGCRIVRDPEKSLYCAAGAVERDSVVVDVRDADDYRSAHVPGSVNVPAYAVATRTFLRGRRVVIVDDGCFRQETEVLCQSLLRQGCGTVRVLDGGIRGWLEAGKPINGTNVGRAVRLAFDGLNASQCSTRWQTVYVGTNSALASVFFPAAQTPVAESQEPSSRIADGGQPSSAERTVIIGDKPLTDMELQRFRHRTGGRVYAAADGLDGYVGRLALMTGSDHSHAGTFSSLSRVEGKAKMSTVGGGRRRGCGCSGS